MQWVSAGLVAVVAVGWFWGPGYLVLTAAGVRGLYRSALAPLVTVTVLGIGATVVGLLGVRWHPLVALGATALATAAAALAPGPAGRRPGRRAAPSRRHLPTAVAFGTAVQVLAVALGMGSPGRVLTAHDAITHLSGLAWVRDGHASALDFQTLEPLRQGMGYYPSGWHAVAGLVPAWPDPLVAFNMAVIVPTALTWTIGLAAVTRALLPARPRCTVWAALLAPSGIAAPLLLSLRPEGMVPNSLATALLPAAIAAAVARDLPRTLWPLAFVGLALVHPNSVLTAVVLLLPWLAPRTGRLLRRRLSTRGGRVAAAATLLGTAVAGAASTTLGAWQAVLAVPDGGAAAPGTQALALLSGNATGLGHGGGAPVVLLAVAGALVVRRLPARWWAWSALGIALLYLAGSSAIPVLRELDRPWYGEAARFAPAIALTLVPLAALALDTLPRWAVHTGRLRTSLAPATVTRVVFTVTAVPSLIVGATGLGTLARATWVGTPDQPALADDAEIAMIERLRTRLPDGAVLGSPFAGAAHLYPMIGVPAVPRSSLVDELPAELSYAVDHLSDLRDDPRVCAALRSAGIRYLYVDPAPWNAQPGLPNLVEPPDGTRLVDSGGSAAVHEVIGCP